MHQFPIMCLNQKGMFQSYGSSILYYTPNGILFAVQVRLSKGHLQP